MNNEREQFASRLGFILMTAGCAIGLGNIWRFPYVAGQYGGGLFVLLYLFFLVFLGFPVMMMELALGRAGRSTYPGAFKNLTLSKAKKPWYIPALILFSGSFILLSFLCGCLQRQRSYPKYPAPSFDILFTNVIEG